MYNVQLKIALIGVAHSRASLWRGIAPLERFKHSFDTITKEEDIPSRLADQEQLLVILNKKSKFNPVKVRQLMPEDSYLVLCVDDYHELSGFDYGAVDDIWLNDGLDSAAFNFNKVLKIISERKQAWLKEAWLQATINTLPDMIWFKDMHGLHLDINDAFCEAVNKSKENIRGRDHYYIWDIPKEVYENSDYVCVETDDDVIAARATCLFDEEVMRADGKLSKLKTYKTPIFDGDTIIGTVGIARDVTQEYEYHKNMIYMINHDQLTGLANRRQLDLFLEKLHTNRMVLACLDLDYFKEINDTYGHIVGDEALVLTAELIKKHFNDTLNVRMGGDEFLVVFTDGVTFSDVPKRVQAFINDFVETFREDTRLETLSVSVGIAEGQIGHGSFDLLLQKADDALYEAKALGRGCFVMSYRDDYEGISSA